MSFIKKNAVKVVLVVVVVSIVVLMNGCSSNHTVDNGGETDLFLGLRVNHKPAPESTTVSMGPKTTTGTVTPVAKSFNGSRSEVARANALRNEVLQRFEGPGSFAGTSNVSNDIATRLARGQ